MLIGYLDVVMQYAYGRSDHRLEDEAWAPDYHDALLSTGKLAGILKQMFFIFTIMQNIPKGLAIILAPSFELVLRIHEVRLSNSTCMNCEVKEDRADTWFKAS